MNRQWGMLAIVGALILVLIGMGWLVRDRFAPIGVGSAAPDFSATDLNGNPVSLTALQGEVVLLNIWATWCPPCREEMPSMQALHENLAEDGLRIIAVSIDAPIGSGDPSGNPGGDVAEFAERMGLTFPIWLNPSGDIQRIYRTTGVPESFVIDRHGNIVKKQIGATDWHSEANQALFERLLEG